MAKVKISYIGEEGFPSFEAVSDGQCCITLIFTDEDGGKAMIDAVPESVEDIINLLQSELDKLNKETA